MPELRPAPAPGVFVLSRRRTVAEALAGLLSRYLDGIQVTAGAEILPTAPPPALVVLSVDANDRPTADLARLAEWYPGVSVVVHIRAGRWCDQAGMASAVVEEADGLDHFLSVTKSALGAVPPAAQRCGPPAAGEDPGTVLARLSRREGEVLALLARGVKERGIAASLGISDSTARTYVRRILDKVAVDSTAQAVQIFNTYGAGGRAVLGAFEMPLFEVRQVHCLLVAGRRWWLAGVEPQLRAAGLLTVTALDLDLDWGPGEGKESTGPAVAVVGLEREDDLPPLRHPSLRRARLVGVGAFCPPEVFARAVDEGVDSWVSLESGGKALVSVVLATAAGDAVVPPSLLSGYIKCQRDHRSSEAETLRRYLSLTAQERRIMELVASGATGDDLARQCYVSPLTIQSHVSRMYKKLRVSSREETAALDARFRLSERFGRGAALQAGGALDR